MRDWLFVDGPHRGPGHLYLVEVLTYGVSNPIKVGIAKNVNQRVSQLHLMGIYRPHLIGFFKFDDIRAAKLVETATRKAFPRCPRYGNRSREILAATKDDLIAFISPRALSAFVGATA